MSVAPPVNQSGVAVLQEYGGILWRSKLLILGCIALSAALSWGYCVFMPNYYL